MSEWKPIETAPRDGTVFLAANEAGVVVICTIYGGGDIEIEDGFWPWQRKVKRLAAPKMFLGLAVPYADTYGVMNLRPDLGFDPTHWMPVPDLPTPSPQ